MSAPARVGILGGMGPEATVLLMSRIIARTPAHDDADHVPLIVDVNTQVPSRIRALIEKTGEDPGPTLAAMARRLEAAGATALAMPCNTAHNYASWITGAVRVPFLDMVELTSRKLAEAIPTGASRTVGVLASPAVGLTGIYDRALARRDVATLYPADQAAMLDAIRAIKRSSADRDARRVLREAARELAGHGAGTLLVACSEFSIIADALPDTMPVVDSIDVLADAVVDFALGNAAIRAAGADQGMEARPAGLSEGTENQGRIAC